MGLRMSILMLAVALAAAGCAGDGSRKSGDDGVTAVAGGDRGASSTGIAGNEVAGRSIGSSGPGAGELSQDLRRSVYYEFDRYDVKPEYRALLESHAAWLRANPKARLMITGNTDERGPSEYNLALGQKRADSVVRLLVTLGASAEQVEAISFGKEKPRAPGHDESAWAENRRSDFARP